MENPHRSSTRVFSPPPSLSSPHSYTALRRNTPMRPHSDGGGATRLDLSTSNGVTHSIGSPTFVSRYQNSYLPIVSPVNGYSKNIPEESRAIQRPQNSMSRRSPPSLSNSPILNESPSVRTIESVMDSLNTLQRDLLNHSLQLLNFKLPDGSRSRLPKVDIMSSTTSKSYEEAGISLGDPPSTVLHSGKSKPASLSGVEGLSLSHDLPSNPSVSNSSNSPVHGQHKSVVSETGLQRSEEIEQLSIVDLATLTTLLPKVILMLHQILDSLGIVKDRDRNGIMRTISSAILGFPSNIMTTESRNISPRSAGLDGSSVTLSPTLSSSNENMRLCPLSPPAPFESLDNSVDNGMLLSLHDGTTTTNEVVYPSENIYSVLTEKYDRVANFDSLKNETTSRPTLTPHVQASNISSNVNKSFRSDDSSPTSCTLPQCSSLRDEDTVGIEYFPLGSPTLPSVSHHPIRPSNVSVSLSSPSKVSHTASTLKSYLDTMGGLGGSGVSVGAGTLNRLNEFSSNFPSHSKTMSRASTISVSFPVTPAVVSTPAIQHHDHYSNRFVADSVNRTNEPYEGAGLQSPPSLAALLQIAESPVMGECLTNSPGPNSDTNTHSYSSGNVSICRNNGDREVKRKSESFADNSETSVSLINSKSKVFSPSHLEIRSAAKLPLTLHSQSKDFQASVHDLLAELENLEFSNPSVPVVAASEDVSTTPTIEAPLKGTLEVSSADRGISFTSKPATRPVSPVKSLKSSDSFGAFQRLSRRSESTETRPSSSPNVHEALPSVMKTEKSPILEARRSSGDQSLGGSVRSAFAPVHSTGAHLPDSVGIVPGESSEDVDALAITPAVAAELTVLNHSDYEEMEIPSPSVMEVSISVDEIAAALQTLSGASVSVSAVEQDNDDDEEDEEDDIPFEVDHEMDEELEQSINDMNTLQHENTSSPYPRDISSPVPSARIHTRDTLYRRENSNQSGPYSSRGSVSTPPPLHRPLVLPRHISSFSPQSPPPSRKSHASKAVSEQQKVQMPMEFGVESDEDDYWNSSPKRKRNERYPSFPVASLVVEDVAARMDIQAIKQLMGSSDPIVNCHEDEVAGSLPLSMASIRDINTPVEDGREACASPPIITRSADISFDMDYMEHAEFSSTESYLKKFDRPDNQLHFSPFATSVHQMRATRVKRGEVSPDTVERVERSAYFSRDSPKSPLTSSTTSQRFPLNQDRPSSDSPHEVAEFETPSTKIPSKEFTGLSTFRKGSLDLDRDAAHLELRRLHIAQSKGGVSPTTIADMNEAIAAMERRLQHYRALNQHSATLSGHQPSALVSSVQGVDQRASSTSGVEEGIPLVDRRSSPLAFPSPKSPFPNSESPRATSHSPLRFLVLEEQQELENGSDKLVPMDMTEEYQHLSEDIVCSVDPKTMEIVTGPDSEGSNIDSEKKENALILSVEHEIESIDSIHADSAVEYMSDENLIDGDSVDLEEALADVSECVDHAPTHHTNGVSDRSIEDGLNKLEGILHASGTSSLHSSGTTADESGDVVDSKEGIIEEQAPVLVHSLSVSLQGMQQLLESDFSDDETSDLVDSFCHSITLTSSKNENIIIPSTVSPQLGISEVEESTVKLNSRRLPENDQVDSEGSEPPLNALQPLVSSFSETPRGEGYVQDTELVGLVAPNAPSIISSAVETNDSVADDLSPRRTDPLDRFGSFRAAEGILKAMELNLDSESDSSDSDLKESISETQEETDSASETEEPVIHSVATDSSSLSYGDSLNSYEYFEPFQTFISVEESTNEAHKETIINEEHEPLVLVEPVVLRSYSPHEYPQQEISDAPIPDLVENAAKALSSFEVNFENDSEEESNDVVVEEAGVYVGHSLPAKQPKDHERDVHLLKLKKVIPGTIPAHNSFYNPTNSHNINSTDSSRQNGRFEPHSFNESDCELVKNGRSSFLLSPRNEGQFTSPHHKGVLSHHHHSMDMSVGHLHPRKPIVKGTGIRPSDEETFGVELSLQEIIPIGDNSILGSEE